MHTIRFIATPLDMEIPRPWRWGITVDFENRKNRAINDFRI